MSGAESFYSGEEVGGEQMRAALVVNVTTLGPRNIGSFGPGGRIDPLEQEQIIEALGSEAYSMPASNTWKCIDDRCSAAELERAATGDEDEADPQIAGSIPTTDTATHYMSDPEEHRPVSVMYATTTREAIADGSRIVMHGDTKNGKAGCAANVNLRDILRFAAENSDILVPQTWEACCQMGLDRYITQDDVLLSVINGKKAADNDALWDATPEERVDIAIANGAEYEEYEGDHSVATDREDRTVGAFAKARFMLDHSSDGRIISAFSTSIGKYKEDAFRRASEHGQSPRDAALKVMRAKLFNRAARKVLTTEDTEVGVVDYARESA